MIFEGIVIMERIVNQLKEQQNLQVIRVLKEEQFYKELLVEKDNQSYLLEMNDISDGFDSICQNKLQACQTKAISMKNCNHPNITKCYSDFILDYHYFILLEKCEMSLLEFINERLLNEQIILKISIQILESVQYLHQKNYFLRDLSLQNIFIDNDQNIKIQKFGMVKQYYPLDLFNINEQNLDKIYYQQLIPENNQCKSFISQTVEGDIWIIGACLYTIAGAKIPHLVKLAQGIEFFKPSIILQDELNQILQQMLQLNPIKRPSISQLIQDFSKILQNSSYIESSNEFLFKLAQQYFSKKQFNQSIVIMENLIEKYPKNDQYLAWLGRLESNRNNYEESVKWSQKAIQINEYNDLAYANIAISNSKQGYLEEAIHYYNKALELNPKFDRVFFNLGVVYEKMSMKNEAADNYKKAIKINPHFDNPLYNLAVIYHDQHKLQLAGIFYKQTLQTNPKYVQAHNNLGVLYTEKQIFESAIKNFNSAHKISPQDEKYILNTKKAKRLI